MSAIPSDLEGILKSETLKQQFLAGANDPVLFVKYFLGEKVNLYLNEVERIHPETGELVKGHPKQRQWLRQSVNAQEGILKAGSRSGKTFVTALMHLWFLFYRKRPTTSVFYGDYSKRFQSINCAPSLKQAKLVKDEIINLVNDSPFLTSIGFIKHISDGQQPFIETCLNSIIWFQATVQRGRFILGFYLDIATLDESASEYALEHLRMKILNVRGTEVSGRKYFISTPQGEGETAGQGAIYFRKLWAEFKERRLKKDNSVVIAEFSQFDNPVNPPETIQANMVNMTQAQIREEVYGKFANYGSTFFAGNYLDIAVEKGERHTCFFPYDDPVTGFCLPEHGTHPDYPYLPKGGPNSLFFTGVDVAGDTNGDSTVLTTLQYVDRELRIVAFERISKTPLFDQNGTIERVKRRLAQFPGELYYDATALSGQYLREALEKELDPKDVLLCTPINSTKKPLKTNKHNHKTLMLSNLAGVVEKAKLVIPYDEHDRLKQLKTELRFYKLYDKGLATDTVMALALAAYAWKRRESNNTYYDEEEGVDYLMGRVA
ncbi:hypothetical protein LC613_28665 [Nostoc sphaeroides CHAB 2801]|uniref:hypothetical protein n=1 Tax=Nostoc sphaeroides TaxID=446679 RepID=UPI000E4E20F5|nr:hypothetical protein [Nostoc sphaeroides]MCC5631693.1 hypothetical protein [Nostoc sphaeroides CHAB 2801]